MTISRQAVLPWSDAKDAHAGTAQEEANTQAVKTQGRVSFYLKCLVTSNTIRTLKLKLERLQG